MITLSVNPEVGKEVLVFAEGRKVKTVCIARTKDVITLQIPASNGSSFLELSKSRHGWIVFDSYTDEDKRVAS